MNVKHLSAHHCLSFTPTLNFVPINSFKMLISPNLKTENENTQKLMSLLAIMVSLLSPW